MENIWTFSPDQIIDIPDEDKRQLQTLTETFLYYAPRNAKKDRYYEGKIPLASVNLGIALPKTFANLEIGCPWGTKTVDVLAARSMFDGFVGQYGDTVEDLESMVSNNHLIAEYIKACRDELKYGATFATLSADPDIGCKIRFHSPETAAAHWNGEKGRIDYGFAVIDAYQDIQTNLWTPAVINYYTDTAIWVLTNNLDGSWTAEEHRHKMGRPLMEAMVWDATSQKPFGRSRLKEPIRHLIEGYVRTVANATIGLEFSTAPQKYLLGVTDDQYDTIINQRFQQYVGSIIAATYNPDTGEKPTFGQLQQGSITPHVEMMRILATQFSAASGLSVTDTGVVNNANPTSSDAILAQTQTLVSMAEELNTSNGDALRNIAMMALAIMNDVSLDELTDEQRDIVPHFKNPAMPSVAVTADAAIKIASARQSFANTDTFLEMIGFSQADIRRIKAQEQRQLGRDVLGALDI